MTEIQSIRASLKNIAVPESLQPFIDKLRTQLRNYESGDAEAKAALRPVMEDSMKKIEKIGSGR